MKKIIFLASMIALGNLCGCSEDSDNTVTPNEQNDKQNVQASYDTTIVADIESGTEASETAPVIEETNCILINLASPSVASSLVDVESKNTKLSIQINATTKTCLHLTGSIDGIVDIDNTNDVDVDIILDNVNITSTNHAGALKLNTNHIEKGNTYLLELRGSNTITGNATDDSKKVIGCDTNLSVTGSGSLNVNGFYKSGIAVDDVFHIYSGNIQVKVARSDSSITEKGFGVKVTHGFVMTGGSLTIEARDAVTLTGYEARGLKVDGADCELVDNQVNANCYGKGKGYIRISGGQIKIDSDAKAISAGWTAEDDALSTDTSDDPSPDVEISGGVLNITTYYTPRDENNQSTSLSPEGIEGKHNIHISGGKLAIRATDDAIQAGNLFEISGGKIVAWSTRNDALDSNGKFIISGGLVAAMGTSEPEGGLDADFSSNLTYSDGILIAIGGANNAPSSESPSFVQLSLSGDSDSSGQNPGDSGQNPGDSGQNPGDQEQPPTDPGQNPDDQGQTPPDKPDKKPDEQGQNPGDQGQNPGDQGQNPGDQGQNPGGSGQQPGNMGGSSVAAGKILALTAQDDANVLAAIQVTSQYSGGANILFLHPNLVKDQTYTIHEATTITANPDFTWFANTILEGNATVTSETTYTQTAGVSVGNQGGQGGQGGGDPGKH